MVNREPAGSLQKRAEWLAGRMVNYRLGIEIALALLRPQQCKHCAAATQELLEALR